MTTPRTVNAERSLLARTVSSAMTATSFRRLARMSMIAVRGPMPGSSLPSQRLDGVEACRPERRIQPEEQADQRRDPDAERHRPDLDAGRDRRIGGDRHGDGDAEERPDQAAED